VLSLNASSSSQESPPQQPSCENNANPVFTADITDMSLISKITPPGAILSTGEVKSHSYLWIKDGSRVPVYAPTDMKLSSGAYYDEGEELIYMLVFEVSCEVRIKFDHIQEPVDAIRGALPSEPKFDTRVDMVSELIEFKAGDLVGHTTGTSVANNWDFGVYNTTLYPNPVTEGVANLEEVDKNADCGYDYFTSDKRAVYKNLFIVSIGSSESSIPYCSF